MKIFRVNKYQSRVYVAVVTEGHMQMTTIWEVLASITLQDPLPHIFWCCLSTFPFSGQPPHTITIPPGFYMRDLRHIRKMVLRTAKLANRLLDFCFERLINYFRGSRFLISIIFLSGIRLQIKQWPRIFCCEILEIMTFSLISNARLFHSEAHQELYQNVASILLLTLFWVIHKDAHFKNLFFFIP